MRFSLTVLLQVCFLTYRIKSSVSSHLGNPATIQPDNVIHAAISAASTWLPSVLQRYARIAYHSQQACQTLGNYPMTTTGQFPSPLTVMPMFESQFRSLETEISDDWSPLTQILFSTAELQLYSFAFPNQENVTQDQLAVGNHRSQSLSRGCIVAISLIHAAASLNDPCSTSASIIRMGVTYAVLFLLKVSAAPKLQVVDPAAVRNTVTAAWSILHRSSEMEYDTFARVCAIIEYLSKVDRDVEQGDLSLIVTSRMSANLLWDAVWRAKDRFSQSVKESKPDDYTSVAAVESLLQVVPEYGFSPSFLDQMAPDGEFLW